MSSPRYTRVGVAGGRTKSALCSYCADSNQVGKLMPAWLQHLMCASCLKRKRRGCGTSDKHKYWLNLDACGMICASFVYAASWYSLYTLVTECLVPWFQWSAWGTLHTVVLLTLVTLSSLCHMRAMLSNPGAVPSDSKPVEPAGWARTCHKCNTHKPTRAHHCR